MQPGNKHFFYEMHEISMVKYEMVKFINFLCFSHHELCMKGCFEIKKVCSAKDRTLFSKRANFLS
jgi:uncharacterized membrane protein